MKSMSNEKTQLLYSKEHEWVRQLGDNKVQIGITPYAQEQLGDMVFVDNPEVGDIVTANDVMGTIESVKAVSEIYSPVSGAIVRVNELLEDVPESVNEQPYASGWLVEIEMSDLDELNSLLNEEEYQAYINKGEE
jgi:glycine cleavage system H protein